MSFGINSHQKNNVRLTVPKIIVAAAMVVFPLALQSTTAHAGKHSAKALFSAKRLPAMLKAETFGFYNKGCLAGGIALPENGPNWQAMRLSRNRRWGHPNLIKLIEQLSIDAKKDGWNGLMVGDMSQPRGGPVSGHGSHQVGLDADIWLRPMPDRRLSRSEREKISAISVLKKGTVTLDERVWTRKHMALLKRAASYSKVQRLFVHPAIKKKLCETAGSDRAWLSKVRPYWGHYYHFHMRIRCQPGSPGCKKQKATGSGDGCDASLDWWFKVALAPKKNVKKKAVKKSAKKKVRKKRRRQTRLSDLPPACRVVLNARSPATLAEVTFNSPTFARSKVSYVATDSAAKTASSTTLSPAAKAIDAITVPKRRPSR